jgi:hypothetical protein
LDEKLTRWSECVSGCGALNRGGAAMDGAVIEESWAFKKKVDKRDFTGYPE